MGLIEMFSQTDAVGKFVAIVMLVMSIASWMLIVWKSRVLWHAKGDVPKSIAAFWQSPDLTSATGNARVFERTPMVSALIASTQTNAAQTLAAQTEPSQRLTRVLRDALHRIVAQLQHGQVVLATVGSTAPFVGLLGTVWGIYHALIGITGDGQVSIDKISGPVGEALIMTAAGLAVAIPAVLAYNVFGKLIGQIEADLEGFAFDLRELLVQKT